MNNITDDTPIAMLTVGQLKEILSIDKIMGHLTPSRAPDKEVLTAADVARLTGYSISTVYKLTSERKIPFHKPEHKGRKLYFTVRRFSTGCRANHTRRSNRKTSGK